MQNHESGTLRNETQRQGNPRCSHASEDEESPLESVTPTPDGDAELLALFKARRGRLAAMVRRRVGPRLIAKIDPDDVLQDVFIRASREWISNPPPRRAPRVVALPPGLATHDRADVRRAGPEPQCRSRSALSPSPWSDDSAAQLADDLAVSQTGVSTAAGREELRDLVRQAIERLEPTDRDIVFLRFYERLPFKAIAAIVGLEENTANQRCVRALLKLKKYLPNL